MEQKNSGAIIGVIIIIILLILGGWLLFKKDTQIKSAETNTQTAQESTSDDISAIETDTGNFTVESASTITASE